MPTTARTRNNLRKRGYGNPHERLAEAEEPAGRVETATAAHTDPLPETTEEQYDPPPQTINIRQQGKRSRKRRAAEAVQSAATSPRSRRPPNYKIHVLTALSLALLIRISRYGTKALTG